MEKRKGARNKASIPTDILEQLNRGELATVNLVEWLAVDQQKLLQHFLASINKSIYFPAAEKAIQALKKQTVNTVNEAIGTSLMQQSLAAKDEALLSALSSHPSDIVKGWATYFIAQLPEISLSEKFDQLKPFAADPHFGVRELAWLAIRPFMLPDMELAISLLSPWALSEDENIRRFASEASRPRGVWCQHSQLLKENAALGLPILEPLKADPSKYVRDSVGNWLNDASKSQAEFVKALCKRWEAESPGKETAYIIKKALRSIQKAKA